MNDQFPLQNLRALGYEHVAINGQKAYHGVAIVSRLPMQAQERIIFGGVDEARHIKVRFDGVLIGGQPLELHNFYVPAGGDRPDPQENPKFRHKLDYLNHMADWFTEQKAADRPVILVGDLNVAPLENDVWSHRQMLKVVSHTPVEVEHMRRLRRSADWTDAMRLHVPVDEKLFTWWSYRAKDWRASNRGRRLDHIWTTPKLSAASVSLRIALAPRSWPRPSDHAPALMDFKL